MIKHSTNGYEGSGELPAGVGIPAGVQPFAHLRDVVAGLRAEWGRRRPLILTHRTPDPDALGAMFGLELLLRKAFDLDPEIAATGKISRAENVAMLRELGLDFSDADAIDEERYAGVFLVDTQPGFGHTTLPEGIPVVAVFTTIARPSSTSWAIARSRRTTTCASRSARPRP